MTTDDWPRRDAYMLLRLESMWLNASTETVCMEPFADNCPETNRDTKCLPKKVPS